MRWTSLRRVGVGLGRRAPVRGEDEHEDPALGDAREAVPEPVGAAEPVERGPRGADRQRRAVRREVDRLRHRHAGVATRPNRSGNWAARPSWIVSATTMISVKMSSNALTSASQSPVIRATASSLVSLRCRPSRSRTSRSGQFGLAPARNAASSFDVGGPAGVVRGEGGLVAGLGGGDEVDRDQDVLLEQPRSAARRRRRRRTPRWRRRCPPGCAAGGPRRHRRRASRRPRRRCTRGSR